MPRNPTNQDLKRSIDSLTSEVRQVQNLQQDMQQQIGVLKDWRIAVETLEKYRENHPNSSKDMINNVLRVITLLAMALLAALGVKVVNP